MAEKLLTGAKMMLYNKIYDKSEVRVELFTELIIQGETSEVCLGI